LDLRGGGGYRVIVIAHTPRVYLYVDIDINPSSYHIAIDKTISVGMTIAVKE
jgi:hypothetical protein